MSEPALLVDAIYRELLRKGEQQAFTRGGGWEGGRTSKGAAASFLTRRHVPEDIDRLPSLPQGSTNCVFHSPEHGWKVL